MLMVLSLGVRFLPDAARLFLRVHDLMWVKDKGRP